MAGFIRGFTGVWAGIWYMAERNLLRRLILPGIISLATAVIIFAVTWYGITHMGLSFLPDSADAPWYTFLLRVAAWAIRLIAVFIAAYLALSLYRTIGAVCIGLSLSPLLDAAERGFRKEKPVRSLPVDLKAAVVSALLSLSYTFRELIIMPFCLLLGPLGVPVLFAVSAWYLGRTTFDLAFEREQIPRARLTARHRGAIFGTGCAMMVMMLIPVAGIFLAPSAGTVSAAAEIWANHEK